MEDFSRRHFVMLGMGIFVAGCAKDKSLSAARSDLPSVPWEEGGERLEERPQPYVDDNAKVIARSSAPAPATQTPTATPQRATTGQTYGSLVGPMPGVLGRGAWATGGVIPARMEKMLPVTRITVHHSALTIYGNNRAAAAAEIDKIRTAHMRDRGWGDIGYHFIVDRNGQVWEGRPLAYQGAHVKAQNEGNIGIMCLGNFDVQTPSSQQQAAVLNHVKKLMSKYRVPTSRVKTHQEMAATACPGRSLQRIMLTSRRSGGALT